ncbi:hypothetical protein, partial [Actinoplanes sp. NPDC049265]|uniref:hypothetical protein n=1 Tax=Actinoplanes sp. NPDC049265 TaxID=3363902 RepID=UPI00371EFA88
SGPPHQPVELNWDPPPSPIIGPEPPEPAQVAADTYGAFKDRYLAWRQSPDGQPEPQLTPDLVAQARSLFARPWGQQSVVPLFALIDDDLRLVELDLGLRPFTYDFVRMSPMQKDRTTLVRWAAEYEGWQEALAEWAVTRQGPAPQLDPSIVRSALPTIFRLQELAGEAEYWVARPDKSTRYLNEAEVRAVLVANGLEPDSYAVVRQSTGLAIERRNVRFRPAGAPRPSSTDGPGAASAEVLGALRSGFVPRTYGQWRAMYAAWRETGMRFAEPALSLPVVFDAIQILTGRRIGYKAVIEDDLRIVERAAKIAPYTFTLIEGATSLGRSIEKWSAKYDAWRTSLLEWSRTRLGPPPVPDAQVIKSALPGIYRAQRNQPDPAYRLGTPEHRITERDLLAVLDENGIEPGSYTFSRAGGPASVPVVGPGTFRFRPGYAPLAPADAGDLSAYLVKLPPAGLRGPTRLALTQLVGLSTPDLRRFADQLRAELSGLRDSVSSRLGPAAAGKDLWGSSLSASVDDRRGDPRRDSADSLRQQVASLLEVYDFARLGIAGLAGWAEGSADLDTMVPPVDQVVSRVLAAGSRPERGATVPLVAAPAGAAWVGRVLPLGEVRGQRLSDAVRWAADMSRPVVVVGSPDRPGPDGERRLIDGLTRVLRSFAYAGAQPLVLTLDATKLKPLWTTFRPVVIARTSDGIDDMFVLYDADGTPLRSARQVTGEMFRHADARPFVPTEHELPPVLLDWLARTDPEAIERFLRDHLTELLAAAGKLDLIPYHEAGVHRTVLNLVRRNGGPADPAGPRFVPVPSGHRDEIAPLQLDRGVPETFAVDYLTPKRSLDDRKAWNDQLVRLVDLREPEEIDGTGVRGLSVAEMLALVSGVRDALPDPLDARHSVGLTVAFTGLAEVLRMPAEVATASDLMTSRRWHDLIMPIATCDLSPAGRQIVIHQFDAVQGRLRAGRRDAYADLVRVVADTVGKCPGDR